MSELENNIFENPKEENKSKKRKPLTEERKQMLRDNLKRGREKSMETRRRNRELKKIENEEKIKLQDEKLLKSLELKRNKKNNENTLLEQIENLKHESIRIKKDTNLVEREWIYVW